MLKNLNVYKYNEKRILANKLNEKACEKDLDETLNYIEDYFNVSRVNVLGERRYKKFIEPRFACYYILRELGNSLHNIANLFNRDHTTILYGSSKIKELKTLISSGRCDKYDIELVAGIESILQKVRMYNYESKAA